MILLNLLTMIQTFKVTVILFLFCTERNFAVQLNFTIIDFPYIYVSQTNKSVPAAFKEGLELKLVSDET